MKAYILAIVGIVLVAALVTLIAPGGKTGRFLKGATRLSILFVMLLPLKALFSADASALSGGTASIKEDGDYLAFCAEELAEGDAAAILTKLEEEYAVTAAVRVERNPDPTFSYRKITVFISDFGITDADEHIYTVEKIQAALEAHYNCPAEVIYEGTAEKTLCR